MFGTQDRGLSEDEVRAYLLHRVTPQRHGLGSALLLVFEYSRDFDEAVRQWSSRESRGVCDCYMFSVKFTCQHLSSKRAWLRFLRLKAWQNWMYVARWYFILPGVGPPEFLG